MRYVACQINDFLLDVSGCKIPVRVTAIPISIDVDSDSKNYAGIAVGGAGGANSAKNL